VCNKEHRFLPLNQLIDIAGVNVQLILEPSARNTTPALTLAALDALAQGNLQQDDVLMRGTHGTLVHAASRLVAKVGVADLVIVQTADAVLVAHRDRSQEVKVIVQSLSEQNRLKQTLHRKVNQPWCCYNNVTRLNENESIYIPLSFVHRLSNPRELSLEIIEVQTGKYLGEDAYGTTKEE
jgi:mannose-1-phosphate guanylyltransferase/mannose-6-phosphate isomerase